MDDQNLLLGFVGDVLVDRDRPDEARRVATRC
jgi:hypothetical protein